MTYQIEFFNARVQASILSWPDGILASFVTITGKMVEYGPDLGLPHTKPMTGGLFEIRAKGPEGIGRALFCTVKGRRIVILHGFIKKTDKTPVADLKLARVRLKEVKNEKLR